MGPEHNFKVRAVHEGWFMNILYCCDNQPSVTVSTSRLALVAQNYWSRDQIRRRRDRRGTALVRRNSDSSAATSPVRCGRVEPSPPPEGPDQAQSGRSVSGHRE